MENVVHYVKESKNLQKGFTYTIVVESAQDWSTKSHSNVILEHMKLDIVL